MALHDLIIYLLVAGICGAIARAVAGGTPGGFLVSVFLGLFGAYVGVSLARALHLPALVSLAIGGQSFPIVWSIAGAMLLVALTHVLMRPRFRYFR
jgi:uncharacterized membrane protein YeaQ/YmgE (transglycosylase-associated protein family)